jgi:hypothetical protein
MRIGRLHLRLAERYRSAALARFDATACYARLGDLTASLQGHPWMVVSGLVEPLTNGRFTRAHGDIDIAVPLDKLGAAAAAVLRSGYVLTTRVLRTHLCSKFDLELHLRIEPGFLAWRHLRLRLWRLTADRELDENVFPPYVDVFPYVVEGREIHILDSGHRLPLQCGSAITASLPGGGTVPVEDPCCLEALRNSCQRAPARGRSPAPQWWPAPPDRSRP